MEITNSEKEPLISVLMPCKDPHLDFFQSAIQSVYRQSCSLWNLIVVDDHSESPETLSFLDQLSKSKDARLTVCKNLSRHVTGAYNTAMRLAKTLFVCSLHCDDLLSDHAIEVLAKNILQYPEMDYFHSARVHIDESGVPISRILLPKEHFETSDFKRSGPVKHLHCWRLQAALSIGGMDESLGPHAADDYDFPWCMLEAGFRFKAIPDCLYLYRDHREHFRLTTHVPLEEQVYELKKIWRKHGMSEAEMEKELIWRKATYLQQAIYLNESDREQKQKENFDTRSGWRFKYH